MEASSIPISRPDNTKKQSSRFDRIIIKIAYVVLIYVAFQIFAFISFYTGLTYGILFLVIVLLSVITYKGFTMKIILHMGLRNVTRRKVNTVIVVFGLMIGTVIISGSLVIGDTLENMFTKGVYDSYDETDETIFTFDENAGEMILAGTHPGVEIECVYENVGFDVQCSPEHSEIEPPTDEELRIIREELDPDRIALR